MSQMSRLWVDPKFKKKLKLEAAKNDLTVLKYTQFLATKDEPKLENCKKYKKNKKGGIFGNFKL